MGDTIRFAPVGPAPTFTGRGSKIEHPDVLPIFWGDYWPGQPPLTMSALMQAVQSIVSGPYLEGMKQYGYSGPPALRALMRLPGSLRNSYTPGSNQIDELSDDVERFLRGLLQTPSAPDNFEHNHDLIIVVFLDPSVPAPMAPSGVSATGANSWLTEFRFLRENVRFEWTWIATSGRTVQQISKTFSHELVESISDPFDTGWHQSAPPPEDGEGQIADVCNQPAIVDGTTVAAYWSIADSACIVPTATTRIAGMTHEVVAQEVLDGPSHTTYVDLGRPLCADGFFEYRERTWRNRVFIRNNMSGYESPHVTWLLNDKVLALGENSVEVDAEWELPPPSKFSFVPFRKPTATLRITVPSPAAEEISISIGPHEGNTTFAVSCTVQETFDTTASAGGGSTLRTVSDLVVVKNQELIWSSVYEAAKKNCEQIKHAAAGGGIGPVTRPGDPPDLAQTLVRLLAQDGPAQSDALRKAALLIRNFHEELYEALMSQAQRDVTSPRKD